MQFVPAIISAAVTLIVCLINNHFQHKESEQAHAVTIALIEQKLTELSDRVDKHNNLIERTYELEKETSVLSEKMSVANHRIDDLEKGA